jgi:hypothetical protein
MAASSVFDFDDVCAHAGEDWPTVTAARAPSENKPLFEKKLRREVSAEVSESACRSATYNLSMMSFP